MIGSLLAYAPPLLVWLATVYKLPALWRRRTEAAIRAYWLTMLVLALALTVVQQPAYGALNKLTGVPNLARLVGNGLALVSAWSVQTYICRLNPQGDGVRPLMRYRGWLLVATLGAMTALFAAAPVGEDAIDFMRRYADAPFILEYRLVYLVSIGIAAVTVAEHAWRYARLADRPALRAGLRLAAICGAAGVGYALNEAGYVIGRRLLPGHPLWDQVLVTKVLIAASVAAGIIGTTMPAWGPRLGRSRPAAWVRNYRSLRRLYPLWRALYRAHPAIAMEGPRPPLADALLPCDVRFRLYRRVIEIRDGRLMLGPYFNARAGVLAQDLCAAAGLSAEEASSVIEATHLAVALRAWERGERREPGTTPPPPSGGLDVASEVAVLEPVARAFARSSIVHAVARMLEPNGNDGDQQE